MKIEIQDIINQLREELQRPLPGKIVHKKMLPSEKLLEAVPEDSAVIQSSVLLLLVAEDETLKIVFIRRPTSMKYHAGQIAFPGGRFEPSDENLMKTALRETSEEIGINPEHIEIIGKLSPLYVVVSNFVIQAFIGWSQYLPSFRINPDEVEELFIIPMENLIDQASLQIQKVDTASGLTEFPGYKVDDIFIWGATGMILTEFIEIFSKIRFYK